MKNYYVVIASAGLLSYGMFFPELDVTDMGASDIYFTILDDCIEKLKEKTTFGLIPSREFITLQISLLKSEKI